MMKDRIKKLVSQIKADRAKSHGPSANDVLMNTIFKQPAQSPAEQFNDRLRELAVLIGVKSDGSPLEIVNDMVTRLQAVPYIPYPVSFSTVDMLPILEQDGKIYVLLGRKHSQTMFQLCGGFRDPAETSEEAAAREFKEEANGDFSPQRFDYQGTVFIDDSRYWNSPHKITTSVFTIDLMPEEVQHLAGGDDIAEVKLFELDTLVLEWENIIRPVHLELFKYILSQRFPDYKAKWERDEK